MRIDNLRKVLAIDQALLLRDNQRFYLAFKYRYGRKSYVRWCSARTPEGFGRLVRAWANSPFFPNILRGCPSDGDRKERR